MRLRQALALGSADHDSRILRIRNKRPEAIFVGEPGGAWHRVPEDDLAEWPEDGWLRPGSAQESLFPESSEPALVRAGNTIFWNFACGVRPGGELSPVGISISDSYAKRWHDTGKRDVALEARFPELQERFCAIRTQPDTLEYHRIEVPLGAPGTVHLFSGTSSVVALEHCEIELLNERQDGTVELSHNPIFLTPKDERLYVRDLRAPVAVMKWAAICGKRVPLRALCGQGFLSGLYVVIEDWVRAMGQAHDILSPQDAQG